MKKSLAIVVLTVFCVLIVLGAVFAFVSLDNGQLGIYDYVAFPQNDFARVRPKGRRLRCV